MGTRASANQANDQALAHICCRVRGASELLGRVARHCREARAHIAYEARIGQVWARLHRYGDLEHRRQPGACERNTWPCALSGMDGHEPHRGGIRPSDDYTSADWEKKGYDEDAMDMLFAEIKPEGCSDDQSSVGGQCLNTGETTQSLGF